LRCQSDGASSSAKAAFHAAKSSVKIASSFAVAPCLG
jgi:hypothetical protein